MTLNKEKATKIAIFTALGVVLAIGTIAYQYVEKSQERSKTLLSQADQTRLRNEILELEKNLKKGELSKEDQVKTYLDMGKKFETMGQTEFAKSAYNHAIKIDSANYISYLNLGILYEAKGDFVRAEEQYKLALDRNPGEWTAWQKLIELYRYKIDDNDRARGAFIEGLTQTKNNIELVKQFAAFLENSGEKTDALAYYQIALKAAPADAELQQAIKRVSPLAAPSPVIKKSAPTKTIKNLNLTVPSLKVAPAKNTPSPVKKPTTPVEPKK